MAGDLKGKFGTSNQTLTISLNSLASSTVYVGRQSTVVDNTSNVFLDALVFVKVKTSASSLANDKAVYVYALATADGGTTYTETAGASDAGLTLTNPPNARLIGVINTPSTATVYNAGPWSVAAAFGGVLPDHWGICVVNVTGQNLDASAGGSAWYQGVYGQYT